MEIFVESFTHDDQPYGIKVLENCVWTPIVADEDSPAFIKSCASKGLGELTGTVVKGGDVSRIMHIRHFRSLVGQQHSVWAVSLEDLKRGYKVTVAM